jgi:hypothetical protein
MNLILSQMMKLRDRQKKKSFKINEKKNTIKTFHYNKKEIIEYFKEIKQIYKENIKNRRQIRLEMMLEKS